MKTNTLIFIAISFFFNLLFLNGQDVVFWGNRTDNSIDKTINESSNTIKNNQPFTRRLKVHRSNERIYWADVANGNISSVDFDGNNFEIIISTPGNINTIYVCEATDKIYFSEIDYGSIKRCNLDGSNVQTIIENTGLVQGLAIDAELEYIFWTANGSLNRAKLNGSDYQIIYNTNEDNSLFDLAISNSKKRLYFSNRAINQIESINVNGYYLETIATVNRPGVISLDDFAKKIAWEDDDTHTIFHSNLEGENPEILMQSYETIGGFDVFFSTTTSTTSAIDNKIAITPSLANHFIDIKNMNNDFIKTFIYNGLGQLIQVVSTAPFTSLQYNTTSLPNGNYILSIHNSKGVNILTQKVIIQH